MNIKVQKYAPPITVLAIAVYLGWPPAAPLDLGEEIVRAKSVRWKVSDLETPPLPAVISNDPFAAVLVESHSDASKAPGADTEPVPTEPVGPTVDDLKIGLRLAGIAHTHDHQWAIINGDVCEIGDRVPVIGLVDVSATIREIADDHVRVVAGPLTIELKQEQRKRRSQRPVTVIEDPSLQTAVKTNSATQETDDQEDEEEREEERENVDSGKSNLEFQRIDRDVRANVFKATT